jgi:site-specific recombinase XerD
MAWIQKEKQGATVRWREGRQNCSRYFPSRQDAENFRVEVSTRNYQQALASRHARSSPEVSHAVKHFLETKPNPVTRHTYERSIFKPLLNAFPNRRLLSVTRGEVEIFAARERLKLSASTFSVRVSVCRHFFDWCMDEYGLASNPFAKIRARCVQKSPGRCLSWREECAILEAATSLQKLKFLLLRDLGFRPSTLCLLRRQMIDLQTHTITFPVLKKGEIDPAENETRTLALTGRVFDALISLRFPCQANKSRARHLIDIPPTGLLFTDSRGRPARPGKFWQDLKQRTLRMTGVEISARMQDVRHTFRTRFRQAGNDRDLAEYAIGHSNLANLYNHPSPEEVEDAFRKFESYTLENLKVERTRNRDKNVISRLGRPAIPVDSQKVMLLRQEGHSWRSIAESLRIPAMRARRAFEKAAKIALRMNRGEPWNSMPIVGKMATLPSSMLRTLGKPSSC